MADSTGRFFEGLLLGGVLGFLFGMLSAPKSGEEMRRTLADGSEDLYKQASEQLTDLKGKTGSAIQDLQTRSGDAIKTASNKVQATRDQVASKLQDMAGKSTQVLVDDVESMTSG